MVDAVPGNRVFPTHQCNVYCRGTIHAQVVWVDIMDQGPQLAEALARELCQQKGATCLDVALAPEAQPNGSNVWDYDVLTGRWSRSNLVDCTPFLVTYDEEGSA